MTRRPEIRALLAQAVTLAGAVVAVIAMVKMAGGASILATPISIWVLLPYILVATTLASRPAPFIGVLALLAAGLFGSILYLDLIFPSSRIRSTAALAFLFVPFWQLGLYVVAVVLSFVFGARSRRPKLARDSWRPARVIAPPPDVDGPFRSKAMNEATHQIRCPRCGAEASYGASECRACEQPFGYPKK